MALVTTPFSKNLFLMFSVQTANRIASIFKFLHFGERFRDGLVWTVGLTVEIKLRFQKSPP